MSQQFWFWAAMPFLVACGVFAVAMFARGRVREGVPWVIGVIVLSAIVLRHSVPREVQIGMLLSTMVLGEWYRRASAGSRGSLSGS